MTSLVKVESKDIFFFPFSPPPPLQFLLYSGISALGTAHIFSFPSLFSISFFILCNLQDRAGYKDHSRYSIHLIGSTGNK